MVWRDYESLGQRSGAIAHGRSISSEDIFESRREMWGEHMREDKP